jgi:AraC-like DNA-binding protein
VARRKTDRRRKALLAQAERVVRERYAEFDLGLADVAEDVGCSTRQLQRVFRELADTDCRSFLLRVRMEQAHRLLSREKHNLTVRQAARAVGYREASGLRQAFVRFYGYNPSAIQPEGRGYLGDVYEPEVAPPVDLS